MIRYLPFFAVVLTGLIWADPTEASEIKVEATLIWGTNDEKPAGKNLKAVDQGTVEKLRKIFKWKYYFEINRKSAVIPSRASNTLRMSKECEIEITELEGPKVAYRLIGRGNPVNKTVASLARGEPLFIGGEDKNGTAWFIMITQLE